MRDWLWVLALAVLFVAGVAWMASSGDDWSPPRPGRTDQSPEVLNP